MLLLALPPTLPANLPLFYEQYSTSQYCLTEYQAQHNWSNLTPQYQDLCAKVELFNGNIDDPELYTLAGYEYIRGADPTSINPETQPLTKYLFGLSTLLFGSPIFVQYLAYTSILILTYLLSRKLLNKWWSLLPPALLLTDKLLTSQLTTPHLDLVTTALVLLYLYLFNRPKLAMIILGLVALAKSFSLGIILFLATLIYLFFTNKKRIIKSFKLSWIVILTYTLGYTIFFISGHSLTDFAHLHLQILRLYKSYVPEYPKGEIFRILVTGEWRKWYDDYGLMKVSEWSLLWPLSLMATSITLFFKQFRINRALFLHITWVITYLIFVSLRLVFPRYLIPVLPSMYIIFVYIISRFDSRT